MNPVEILGRTIWGEARGCGADAMRHVASAIMNRVSAPCWWGTDVASVCQKHYQFSCWNVGDPNREKLLAVNVDDPEFVIALSIADNAVDGTLVDETGGADSYYALTEETKPDWAQPPSVHTFTDGWHSFWRTRGGAKAKTA